MTQYQKMRSFLIFIIIFLVSGSVFATSLPAPQEPLPRPLRISGPVGALGKDREEIILSNKAQIQYFSKAKDLKGYGISCGAPQFPKDTWHLYLFKEDVRVDIPFKWKKEKIIILNECGICLKLKSGKLIKLKGAAPLL